MSKIVKSRAVVASQQEDVRALPQEAVLARIIKHRYLEQPGPSVSTDYRVVAPKDLYLEELNRLKIEIEEAREELRRLRTMPPEPAPSPETAREPEAEEEEVPPEVLHAAPSPEEAAAAQDLLDTARQEAEAMLQEAEQEAQQLVEQAQNEGYLQGFNKGYEEAVAEFLRINEPKSEQIADLVEALSEFEQNRLRQNEQELIDLALGIASKIVGRELRTKPQTILKMLEESVQQNHNEEYIRITLADELLPMDVKASAEIKQMLLDLGANVSVLTDSRVKDGTVQMETPKGIIDMSVDTQLENIRSILHPGE